MSIPKSREPLVLVPKGPDTRPTQSVEIREFSVLTTGGTEIQYRLEPGDTLRETESEFYVRTERPGQVPGGPPVITEAHITRPVQVHALRVYFIDRPTD